MANSELGPDQYRGGWEPRDDVKVVGSLSGVALGKLPTPVAEHPDPTPRDRDVSGLGGGRLHYTRSRDLYGGYVRPDEYFRLVFGPPKKDESESDSA